MKKISIFLFLLTLLCGFAVAEEIGLDAGVELSGGDVADEFTFGVAPIIKYENSFENFDLYLEAQYFFVFDDDLIQAFYLEEEVAYNLEVGPGILSLILNNQNNFFVDVPEAADDYDGVIEPSVKYTQGFDFGELFLQGGVPITYQPDTIVDTFLRLGYYNYGFGVELTGVFNIDPDAEMAGYELLLNYEQDLFYVEVELLTDKEFDAFTISPYGELFIIDRVTFWAGIDFYNVGGDGDVIVEPYIGASYKF